MEIKNKLLGTFLVLLLAIGFLGFFGSLNVVDAAPTIGRVEYDYYAVAGYKMTPTLPPVAGQPAGFTFTCHAFAENTTGLHYLGTGGYDFGYLDHHGGRSYLTAGTSISEPTGSNWNAYIVVNITNNLGYTITIEDLTAEIIDGTPKGYGLPGDLWNFDISGENLGNVSMIVLDTLDPWDYNHIDEVDYNTPTVSPIYHPGTAHQIREDAYPDHYRAATGRIRAATMGRGPGSLLENDYNGDAATSGHVPPKYGGSTITLAAGETFTEYFGLCVLGELAEYTQFNATTRLRLYYSPPPGGEQAVVDAQFSNLQPRFPAYYDDTTYVFQEWGGLNINATLANLGNVPIDLAVNCYYSKDLGASWVQIGSTQNVLNLPVATRTLVNFNWNVKAANLSAGWHFLKANATATSAGDPATPDTCEFNLWMRCVRTGNSDGDNDVDVGDQRKTQLAMFTSYPQAGYIAYNNAPQYGPQIFTDFDGDLDVDVGDQRKQQLNMFGVDPTTPTS